MFFIFTNIHVKFRANHILITIRFINLFLYIILDYKNFEI